MASLLAKRLTCRHIKMIGMPTKLGIVVVGTGYSAQMHMERIARIPELKLVGVVSRESERAKLIAQKYNAETSFSDLSEPLKREDVDIIDINLPNFLHKDAAVSAAQAGKHVLCEKPIATTLEEADEMIDAARRAGVKLMVAQDLRFSPEYVAVKEAVDRNLIGEPVAARALRIPGDGYPWSSWHLKVEESGGILDILIHDVDYVRYLFGSEVECVVADGGTLAWKNVDVFDHAFVLMRFRNGRIAQVTGSWIRPINLPLIQSLEVHGTGGYISMNSLADQKVVVHTNQGITFHVRTPESDGVYDEIRHFTKCVIENKNPIIPPEDSRASLEVSLAALRSIQTRKHVWLPLQ